MKLFDKTEVSNALICLDDESKGGVLHLKKLGTKKEKDILVENQPAPQTANHD